MRIIEDLRAHEEMRTIPIVLCTGAEDAVESVRPRLDALGVPIVVKPFSLDELERALARALRVTADAE
jgi:DNA-binding response OmpR family regulator